jgi:hypothetical protein
MLRGRYQRARGITQDGCEFGCGDGAKISTNLTLTLMRKTGANEPQARAGLGRMKGERDRQAGVNSDTGQDRLFPKRGLLSAFHTFVPLHPPATE